MEPHEIKCAVVTRMYRDGIMQGQRYADVKTVAQQAVPPGSVGDAVDEIEDHMLDDEECPVQEVSSDVVTLENDREKTRYFLARYCGDEEEWPASLRSL